MAVIVFSAGSTSKLKGLSSSVRAASSSMARSTTSGRSPSSRLRWRRSSNDRPRPGVRGTGEAISTTRSTFSPLASAQIVVGQPKEWAKIESIGPSASATAITAWPAAWTLHVLRRRLAVAGQVERDRAAQPISAQSSISGLQSALSSSQPCTIRLAGPAPTRQAITAARRRRDLQVLGRRTAGGPAAGAPVAPAGRRVSDQPPGFGFDVFVQAHAAILSGRKRRWPERLTSARQDDLLDRVGEAVLGVGAGHGVGGGLHASAAWPMATRSRRRGTWPGRWPCRRSPPSGGRHAEQPAKRAAPRGPCRPRDGSRRGSRSGSARVGLAAQPRLASSCTLASSAGSSQTPTILSTRSMTWLNRPSPWGRSRPCGARASMCGAFGGASANQASSANTQVWMSRAAKRSMAVLAASPKGAWPRSGRRPGRRRCRR